MLAFFHLLNIRKIINILTHEDTDKLTHAFVTSRLDYCNKLHSCYTNSSFKNHQLVQNSTACVLTRTENKDHISLVLASLNYFPVKSRIKFKILLLT